MICICVSSLSLTYPYPHQILINVRSIIIGPKEVFFSYWVSEMIWWKSSENRTLKSVKTLLWLTEWKWSAPLCSSFPCTTGAQIYIETENDLTYNIQIFRKIKTQIFLLISHWDSSIVVVYLRPLCQIPNLVSHYFNCLTLKLQDLQLVILSRRALTRMMMTASMLIYRRLWWRSEQVGNMLAQCILSVPAELAFYDAPHHPPFYFVIQQFAQLTYNYDFLAAGQGWY